MKYKYTLIAILLLSSADIAKAQSYCTLDTTNNGYIFQYSSSIYIILDTFKYKPINFEIELPKGMKYFESINSSVFKFYYRSNQVICIKTDIFKEKEVTIDTMYIPTEKEIYDIIKHVMDDSEYDKKTENIYFSKKYMLKNNLLKIQNGTEILLFNIKDKNIKEFYNKILSFKIIE
jgi:hypothetical protein